MTDILTHSVILQTIEPYLTNEVGRILDIGTGHGYLAFAIAKILQKSKMLRNQQIRGTDISTKAIDKCKQIHSDIFPNLQLGNVIQFEEGDIGSIIRENMKYDIIIAGFYVERELSEKLQERLSEKGVGIWATETAKGQALFKLSSCGKK